MRLNLLAASLAVASLSCIGLAQAGEGMWVPSNCLKSPGR